jgi:hypothetical protein
VDYDDRQLEWESIKDGSSGIIRRNRDARRRRTGTTTAE